MKNFAIALVNIIKVGQLSTFLQTITSERARFLIEKHFSHQWMYLVTNYYASKFCFAFEINHRNQNAKRDTE